MECDTILRELLQEAGPAPSMNGREANLHLFHGTALDVISGLLMRPEWRRPGYC